MTAVTGDALTASPPVLDGDVRGVAAATAPAPGLGLHSRRGGDELGRAHQVTPGSRSPKPTRRQRKAMGRMRARKVRRVLRHVDPWAVLKVSLLFNLCLFIIVMVAGTMLWNLASAAGTIADIESFIEDLGAFETFAFEAGQIFRACLFGGLVLVVAGTGVTVLLAVLFNLISDLVGGIRVTVIEEETLAPPTHSARPRPNGAGLDRSTADRSVLDQSDA